MSRVFLFLGIVVLWVVSGFIGMHFLDKTSYPSKATKMTMFCSIAGSIIGGGVILFMGFIISLGEWLQSKVEKSPEIKSSRLARFLGYK